MTGSSRPDNNPAREDSESLLRALSREGAYDEIFTPSGDVRAHQQQLLAFLDKTNPEEMERHRRLVRQRMTEQEVTYNLLGVPNGTNRPWQLDLLPVVVDPPEWAALEAGLAQRARLLSAVAADLYGPRRLLREGIIPPALILEHPWYFRSCATWAPIGGHCLSVYGVDLGRDSSGQFFVFSDRTAAPTGAGYALENRLVLGRTLSGLFNGYGVERVRRFFETWRRSVSELSPQSTEEPHIVLLSSGQQDESSFEHAYLARYLGYQLVEGRDLTVRDQNVYLKTLSGLRRVDVILRRVHDANCDPTSLREDSYQGVPGLVEVAAAGNVGLANPLGVSLLESPVIKAYLAAICRFLFGGDLLIPSVETLWLGDPNGLSQVLSNLDDFVLKPALEERQGEPVVPVKLSIEAKAELKRRLQSKPGAWVAERWPALSTTAYFEKEKVKYGSVSLRTFLCRDGDGYQVMPGGLGRINAAPDGLFLSSGGEQASKDIWVPTRHQNSNRPPPSMPDRGLELRRGGVDLPSRLLDDIFWLGRYVERAEMTARLLRSGYDCLGSESGEESQVSLLAIVNALKKLEVVPSGETASVSPLKALNAALCEDSPSSLRTLCRQIHQSTVRVRSHLSRDAWNALKRLSVPPRASGTLDMQFAATELLVEVLVALASVSGTIAENMVRGHAWTFLDMGRRVERGATMLGVLQALLPQGASRVHLETLLDIADSRLTYRARYLSKMQVAPVVDLVLTDDTNPRSVMFQVNELSRHVNRLPKLGGALLSQAERRAIELQAKLATTDVTVLCAGDGQALRTLIEESQVAIFQVSDDVTQHWLSHATQRRSASAPKWVDAELEVR